MVIKRTAGSRRAERLPAKLHRRIAGASSGETLVEVMASVFIFLIMMGILQGAISYSSASLNKNKEIRADNAAILEGLQAAPETKDSSLDLSFQATNRTMSVLGDKMFKVPTELHKKTVYYTDTKGESSKVTFYLYGSPIPDTDTGENGTPEDESRTSQTGGDGS